MLDAAAFVDRALGRARTALVPAHLAATVFEAAASRLRPELVARIEAIFAARPWPGWLTKAEREQLRGRRVRRRAPWPRDPREVPFRLNEQHRLLDLHYATETVARGKDTRTLRLFRKNPHVELADVRLHAWEAPRARIRRSVADVTRAELQRNVDLLPRSGRGVAGCRLITYQLTSEDGAIYRALVAKGLRPVTRSDHRQAGGARSRVALAGAKIRWEAGPAAGPPDWNLLQPQHRPGARAAFDAFERRHKFSN